MYRNRGFWRTFLICNFWFKKWWIFKPWILCYQVSLTLKRKRKRKRKKSRWARTNDLFFSSLDYAGRTFFVVRNSLVRTCPMETGVVLGPFVCWKVVFFWKVNSEESEFLESEFLKSEFRCLAVLWKMSWKTLSSVCLCHGKWSGK